LTPSKRLQNVKSSKKIDYTQGLRLWKIQPGKTNSEPRHLFRFAQKIPGCTAPARRPHRRHLGGRTAISPLAGIDGERPDPAWNAVADEASVG
jgi:hypothetical protein